MQIRSVTKWIVEDFTEEEAQAMRRLGWQWMDSYDRANDHELRYGHFFTYDRKVFDQTCQAIPRCSVTALCSAATAESPKPCAP